MKTCHSLLLAVVLCGCTTGSVILTGTPRAATVPEAVKVYSEAPAGAEVIAEVTATSGSGWTFQQDKDNCLRELKKRAAQLGANGVVIVNNEDDLWAGSKVTAKAIFVEPARVSN